MREENPQKTSGLPAHGSAREQRAPRHTPGPWVLFNKMETLAIHRQDGKPIVAWPGFDSADVGPHAVNVANAKLIAAAPALADALERLAAAFEDENAPDCTAALRDATAALRAAGRLPRSPEAKKGPDHP